MPRRTQAQIQFDAISLEGGLLAPEWLSRAAALDAPPQTPADYNVPKGLQLRDEIGRYWRIAGALWADLAAARAHAANDPTAATRRFAEQLLGQVLGFDDLTAGGVRHLGDRSFPLVFVAHGGSVPVVVGAHDVALDTPVERHGDAEHGVRRRTAWGLLQEYLNAADDALWGIATNGLTLRVGRDNASLTRPAWLEADLERIFTEQRFADFSVLWLVAHASRFGRAGQAAAECPLERWRADGRKEGSRAREQLRTGVEEALLALGQGFVEHPANGALRAALTTGELTPPAYFNELLRLVYRFIFLITVEERDILHPADAPADAVRLYAEGYGLRRLRERALRHSAHDQHADLWNGLRPVFAALGSAAGEPALALPGLGGLFEPAQCPHLDGAQLANRRLLAAVFRLAWLREGGALARVNWKDMGVEEFGSVYESLLELVPQVGAEARSFAFAGAGESAGNARKLTGSYYTPDALVQQLLDTALEPVVADRVAAGAANPVAAILSITVVDPACGSGHFLLAAARRLAGHLARLRAGGTPGAAEYRHALRDVVTHCIHGVDRNPMALELARMALWLEAYTPDRALGFLDHHLVCGDALLGLLDFGALKDGIPDEAFKALTGDDRDVAKTLTKLNRAGRKALEQRQSSGQFAFDLGTTSLAVAFAGLDALGDDALAGVEAKRARYAELQAAAESSTAALAADCFVGAFLMPKRPPEAGQAATELVLRQRFPTSATLAMALDGTLSAGHPVTRAAQAACDEARVLHWPLAFPQVFGRGGFDVVLGNPPWERMKLQEQEYFAARAPQVATARNKAERDREIAKLAVAPAGTPERAVHEAFERAKQVAEAASVFCHAKARYPLTGVGDVNTYALFAETMYRAASPNGRVGVVVPTGIATDDSTKAFFAEVAENARLASLYDFENRDAIFADVHRSFKFSLLTLGRASEADFAFFAAQVADLKDARRRFRLAPADFMLINPNTRTCPVFRSEADARLATRIYRNNPVIRSDDPSRDSGWAVRLRRMYDKSTDAGVLQSLTGSANLLLPVYEGDFGHQFNHRYATFGLSLARTDSEWLSNPHNSVQLEYGVDASEFERKLRSMSLDDSPSRSAFLGFRRVARSTDERTVIACVFPWQPSTYGWILTSGPTSHQLAFLCGTYNSLVFDWLVRCALSQPSVPQGVFEQTAVPARGDMTPRDFAFVVSRVLELTYTACDLTLWARDLGYDGPPFAWNPDRRAMLRAELDAYYAHAYGLTRDELRYVLDPADVMGPDYPSETFRVLKNNELRQFGEYRTRRLVLEAWDRLFDG